VKTEVPTMPENPSENDKYVWEYKMSDYLKSEKVLKGNLRSLYTFIMSLCDTEVKNQVRALEGYREFNKMLDSMTLLREIKKKYTLEVATIYMRTRQWHILVLWTCNKRNIKISKTSGTNICPSERYVMS